MFYGKKENLEMPEINRKLSKSKKHPVLTITITGKLLKSNQFVIKYHFSFNNKKSYFQTSMLGFVDNFEQHFEGCVLNTQNPLKR